MLVWFILVRKFILSRNCIKYNTLKLLSVARFRQIDYTIDWIMNKFESLTVMSCCCSISHSSRKYFQHDFSEMNTTSRKLKIPNNCHATLRKLNASLISVGNFPSSICCCYVTEYWENLHETSKTSTINFDTTLRQLPVLTAWGQKVTRI